MFEHNVSSKSKLQHSYHNITRYHSEGSY